MLLWSLEQCKPERGALSHCVRFFTLPSEESGALLRKRPALHILRESEFAHIARKLQEQNCGVDASTSPGHCLIYPHNTSEKEVRNRQMSQVSTVRVKGGGVFVPLD